MNPELPDPRTLYSESYFDRMRGHEAMAGAGASLLYQGFIKLANLSHASPLAILDVGCGRGELIQRLTTMGCGEVRGFDFAPAAVKIAREQLAKLGVEEPDYAVLLGSIADPKLFSERQFDIAFMTDVVEHLPEELLLNGLKNVKSWLKPGGRLIIHTFPTLGPHRLFNFILRLKGEGARVDNANKIHCNVQTRKKLTRTLTQAGFEIENIWVRNDLTLTSSAYQKMKDGKLKRFLKFFSQDFLNLPLVAILISALGLSEFAKPSIYCVCTRPSS